VPRQEVVANQRERLFGAMVTSVAKRGFAATTVNHLVEISGVSSRTFYDLFADKQTCFLATLKAMIEAAVAYAAQNAGEMIGGNRPGGVTLPETDREDGVIWEERARFGVDAFAEMVVAQPAAARLAMVESYAAGPEAMVLLENAVAGFEWLTRQMLAQSPERAEMPAEMITAHIGAQQEITRTRLRRGREAELPELMDEIFTLMLSYRPPPFPLRLAGRPPRPGPERIEAHDHAERALGALNLVVAEHGYADTTVEMILRRAQMSATTFYAHFGGKEEAMLAAVDSSCAQLVAAVLPAFRRAPEWPGAVRGAIGALCNFLASRPALANLVTAEVYAAGPAALERRAEALVPLEVVLREGYRRAPQVPPITAEVVSGGVQTLVYRRLRESGAEALPSLAPLLTYIALSPFLGPERAAEAANGDGRGRPGAQS
jgi:AcrR family transcriptional regulator